MYLAARRSISMHPSLCYIADRRQSHDSTCLVDSADRADIDIRRAFVVVVVAAPANAGALLVITGPQKTGSHLSDANHRRVELISSDANYRGDSIESIVEFSINLIGRVTLTGRIY